jgi:hypothetical protein
MSASAYLVISDLKPIALYSLPQPHRARDLLRESIGGVVLTSPEDLHTYKAIGACGKLQ